tara:strand:+ start:389 stop:1105 length:717 start_codon:yes stop_codon:yes gene_type:complete
MWIFKKEKIGNSGCYEENFLFKEGKFYIMDNHRSASWCWLREVDLKKNYNLFHIDRHYDLLENLSIDVVNKVRPELLNENYSKYSNAVILENKFPIVRFDNYILLIDLLFPNLFSKKYFATHEDGTYPEDFIYYSPDLFSLPNNICYWMNEKHDNNKWILNIDLDYFFTDDSSGVPYQFLTDEYIIKICENVSQCLPRVEVVTIALSPDFCNGWANSFSKLKLITDFFNLDFPYSELE